MDISVTAKANRTVATKLKQVIVVPGDVKMSPGKLAAQVAHASCGVCIISSKRHLIDEWYKQGMTKIVLQIPTTKELLELEDKLGFNFHKYLVKDAGNTELEPGTITALAIGPANSAELDKLTGHLRLL